MPHTVMRRCGAVRSTAVADGQRRHGTQPGSAYQGPTPRTGSAPVREMSEHRLV